MKKIAIVVESDFQDEEFTEPYKALQENGFQVTIVGPEANKEYKGKHGRGKARTDKSFDQVQASDFDGLVIPGGQTPERLRLHPKAVEFVKAFGRQNKPIAAICHGPQLLISADLLRGRKATSYQAIAIDLKNAGAHFIDAPVVTDGNLITSRTPDDLPQFCEAMTKAFRGEKATAKTN